MNPYDVLGHIFYASLALGMILLVRGSPWGWVFRLIGELGWMILGVAIGFSSIVVWGMIFIVVDCVGVYRNFYCKSQEDPEPHQDFNPQC